MCQSCMKNVCEWNRERRWCWRLTVFGAILRPTSPRPSRLLRLPLVSWPGAFREMMTPWCWLRVTFEGTMRNKGNELAQEYGAAMRDYLAKGDENALQRAYELGRRALTDGFGLMDLTRAHQEALDLILTEAQTPGERERAWSLAPGFFTESLWSFEMVHRGFRETNRLLRELNSLLENRARELSCANDELKREIEGRFRLEELLLEREEALRGLSRQILVTGEEERKRISRELHDQVGQALTAINVNLAMLRKLKSSSAIGRKAAD